METWLALDVAPSPGFIVIAAGALILLIIAALMALAGLVIGIILIVRLPRRKKFAAVAPLPVNSYQPAQPLSTPVSPQPSPSLQPPVPEQHQPPSPPNPS